jgi:ribA/ribD-fused uncharacterized protein
MPRNHIIRFFKPDKVYGELSNFYVLPTPITYDGISYKTSEHLYQACKYIYEGSPSINKEYVKIISNASTPYKAKILANQKKGYKYPWQYKLNNTIDIYRKKGVTVNPMWDHIKKGIMHFVLDIKFSSNDHCRSVLLSTGNSELVEVNPYDKFWSENLGRILMDIRNIMRYNV